MEQEQERKTIRQLETNGMLVPDDIAPDALMAETTKQMGNIEPSEKQTARESKYVA